jgi:hypothetical protein
MRLSVQARVYSVDQPHTTPRNGVEPMLLSCDRTTQPTDDIRPDELERTAMRVFDSFCTVCGRLVPALPSRRDAYDSTDRKALFRFIKSNRQGSNRAWLASDKAGCSVTMWCMFCDLAMALVNVPFLVRNILSYCSVDKSYNQGYTSSGMSTLRLTPVKQEEGAEVR